MLLQTSSFIKRVAMKMQIFAGSSASKSFHNMWDQDLPEGNEPYLIIHNF